MRLFFLISVLFAIQGCGVDPITPQTQIKTSGLSNLENVGSTVSGYIFYGEYPVGNKVCEFPAINNCKTNADGGSAGAMGIANTGLNVQARLHKLSFVFQSNGYFAKNPSGHIPVGLRGRITRNAKGDPTAVNGRGIFLGTLGSDPRNNSNPACLKNMLQVETYHGDYAISNPSVPHNHVFSNTCSDTIIQDRLTYSIELYVSSDRKIGYKVYDGYGMLIHSQLMQDPHDYLDPNFNDFFFGHVFESPITSPAGNWSFIIQDIKTSSSDEAIENYFTTPIMQFYLGQSLLSDNSLITLKQLKSTDLFIKSFSPQRTRIFGCSNTTARVDSGTSCRLAADFRAINMSGDESYQKVGDSLKFLSNSLYSYPANDYKMVLRTNPESSHDQITVRIDSRIQ